MRWTNTPQVVTDDLVGVEVSATSVRAAVVRHGQLLLTGQTSLRRGTVSRGDVLDPQGLTGALERLWRENDIGSRRVHVVISSDYAQLTTRTFPNPGDAEDLRRLIGLNFQPDRTPSVVSFSTLSALDAAEVEVLIVAVPTEVVRPYLRAVRRAGLVPEAIGLASIAAPQGVESGRFAEEALLLHTGEEMSQLLLVRDGQAVERLLVPMGALRLRDALAQAVTDGADRPANDLVAEETEAALLPLVDAVDTLRARMRSAAPEAGRRLLVTGVMADIPGVVERIAGALLAFDVVEAPPRDGLGDESFSSYAASIGACFQPIISLLDAEIPDASQSREARAPARVGATEEYTGRRIPRHATGRAPGPLVLALLVGVLLLLAGFNVGRFAFGDAGDLADAARSLADARPDRRGTLAVVGPSPSAERIRRALETEAAREEWGPVARLLSRAPGRIREASVSGGQLALVADGSLARWRAFVDGPARGAGLVGIVTAGGAGRVSVQLGRRP